MPFVAGKNDQCKHAIQAILTSNDNLVNEIGKDNVAYYKVLGPKDRCNRNINLIAFK